MRFLTKAKERSGDVILISEQGKYGKPIMYRQELKSQWFKGSYDNKLHSDNPCACAITVRKK